MSAEAGTPVVPKIVSVDDHVVEPAHLWEKWLPEKYRDSGPKIIRRGLGSGKAALTTAVALALVLLKFFL